jgi:hypothetical protein
MKNLILKLDEKTFTKDFLPLIPDGPQKIGFGTTTIPKQNYLNWVYHQLSDNQYNLWCCYTDTGEPVSFISTFDFPNLPYYTITNFKVVKKFDFYNEVTNGYLDLMNHCIEQQELKHLYSFYTFRAFGRKKNNRLWMTKSAAKNLPKYYDRYTKVVEEFIPAGQASKYDYFNKVLLRDKIYENDTAVMKWTCKDQYREILDGEQKDLIVIINKMVGMI